MAAAQEDRLASLKYDPFLTRQEEPEGGYPFGANGNGEAQPLVSTDGPPPSKGGEAKLMILPPACCMMTQTIISVVALALAFSETGHKDGYEEGHLDKKDQDSGCEGVFYWMMLQAGLDLLITCFTCLFLVSSMKVEPVGVHGCCATVRLCTLAAGFHILYFSGLKRELCDPFLIIWSTILVWLGVLVMLFVGCVLTFILLGVAGSAGPQYRQLRRMPPKKPAAYQTTVQQQPGYPP